MSWLDDFLAPALTQMSPATTAAPKVPNLKVLGKYAFAQGVVEKLETLVNAFAPIVGGAAIPVDGLLSAGDAERLATTWRKLLSDYACNPELRKQGLAQLELQLDDAARMAKLEGGGVTVTPEQMWASVNQDALLFKLAESHAQIVAGKLKRCAKPMPWGWIGLGIAGVLLLGGRR